MERCDVIVVGGGVSGAAFAWRAAAAGRAVVLLEGSARTGGCLHSVRLPDGYWYELGAHTTYNSYGGFLDLAAGSGAAAGIVERGPDYARWLRPFLAAVPSQDADGFPAAGPGSLFKKRPRRAEYPRSFGFAGGLQTVCDAALRTPGVRLETGAAVTRLAPLAGAGAPGAPGFVATTADGRSFAAPVAAVATPVDAAAALLGADFPELAQALGRVRTVSVESLGVTLPRASCWMPEVAFVIPARDVFHSAVTRDPFPDPGRRAFSFHFRSGPGREEQLRRMAEVLRRPVAELGEPAVRRTVLPAPALGHDRLVADLDRLLAGSRLALTGNYFQGLAIEDCVQRSFAEHARVGP